MPGTNGQYVKATRTSFAVVETVRRLDGAGISEIARHLDRSKSGIYKHVRTLADEGYLVQRGDEYHVGLGMWALGATVCTHFPIDEGKQAVDSLAASVDRMVSLVLYEAGKAVVTHVNNPLEGAERGHEVGDVLPLHASASGKVILAYASQADRDRVFEGPLQSFTDATVTDPEALRAELDSVRKRRTATDRAELDPHVECVAAPIVQSPGNPVGAISVSGLTADGDDVADSVQGLVVSASRSVENTLSATDE